MGPIEFLTQPLFWVFSAFASILLSVVANLVSPYQSVSLTQVFGRRKAVAAQKRTKVTEADHRLYADREARINAKLNAVYWIATATLLLVFSVLVVVLVPYLRLPTFGTLMSFIVGALGIAVAGKWLLEARRFVRPALLADSRERVRVDYEGRPKSVSAPTLETLLVNSDAGVSICASGQAWKRGRGVRPETS